MRIETGFLCGDGARGSCFFARVIPKLGSWTQKVHVNVDYCHIWRRAECTPLRPGLKHASLRSLTLVRPRRDVPRRFTWYFFCRFCLDTPFSNMFPFIFQFPKNIRRTTYCQNKRLSTDNRKVKFKTRTATTKEPRRAFFFCFFFVSADYLKNRTFSCAFLSICYSTVLVDIL